MQPKHCFAKRLSNNNGCLLPLAATVARGPFKGCSHARNHPNTRHCLPPGWNGAWLARFRRSSPRIVSPISPLCPASVRQYGAAIRRRDTHAVWGRSRNCLSCSWLNSHGQLRDLSFEGRAFLPAQSYLIPDPVDCFCDVIVTSASIVKSRIRRKRRSGTTVTELLNGAVLKYSPG